MTQKPALILLIFAFLGCSPNPYKATNSSYKQLARAYAQTLREQPSYIDSTPIPAYWVGTTNFGMRKANFVIIHHTAQTACDTTLKTFTLTRTEVSAHYVICKDGTIHHMLNDWLRAWHAGAGRWGNVTDINSVSIGIELDNTGFEPFSEAQLKSLMVLLKKLKKDNNIPVANFIGHADIAPTRKVDPSKYFPWQQLSQNGFGYWYDTTTTKLPADFNAIQSLRIIGYDIKDPVAAVKAFKLHFVPQDSVGVINEGDKKIIYELSRKYQ